MMIAASVSLAHEGATSAEIDYGWLASMKVVQENQAFIRTVCGFIIGMSFIIITKRILDRFEGVKTGDIDSSNMQKMVLILFVMTLHSLSEGIGIGE